MRLAWFQSSELPDSELKRTNLGTEQRSILQDFSGVQLLVKKTALTITRKIDEDQRIVRLGKVDRGDDSVNLSKSRCQRIICSRCTEGNDCLALTMGL